MRGIEPLSIVPKTIILPLNYIQSTVLKTAILSLNSYHRKGIEPSLIDYEPTVLPLHHRWGGKGEKLVWDGENRTHYSFDTDLQSADLP